MVKETPMQTMNVLKNKQYQAVGNQKWTKQEIEECGLSAWSYTIGICPAVLKLYKTALERSTMSSRCLLKEPLLVYWYATA